MNRSACSTRSRASNCSRSFFDLWRRDKKTALMVTHDVDEALFLTDRIVMMTNGPAARVGDVLHVPFPRPRNREAVMDHPEYDTAREELIQFLESQAHPTPVKPTTPPPKSQSTPGRAVELDEEPAYI